MHFGSRRLRWLLAVSVALIVAMGWLGMRSIHAIETRSAWLMHSQRVRLEIGRVLQLLTDVETGARGYVAAHDEQFLQPYRSAVVQLDPHLTELRQLVVDNPTQRRLAERLADLAHARVGRARRIIDRIRDGELDPNRNVPDDAEGKQSMDAVRDVTARMQTEEERLLALRADADARAHSSAQGALLSLSALAVALLALIAYVSARDATKLWRVEEALAAAGVAFARGRQYFEPMASPDTGRDLIGESVTGEIQKSSRRSPWGPTLQLQPRCAVLRRLRSEADRARVQGARLGRLVPAPVDEPLRLRCCHPGKS